ncbi:MAG: nuclear transport factor 2 family protein [Paracoccaceae bacterium]
MDALEFANGWEAGWTSHDLARIVSHYRDDVLFRSRRAIEINGSGEINGKPALRANWGEALRRQPALRFRVQDVFGGHEMLTITYLNQRGVLAAETLYFDNQGLVFRAAACHRA